MAAGDTGDVYVGGSFADTVDFDPGPGTWPLTSNGQTDGYVVKLDPSGGFVWAGQIGGPLRDGVAAVALDRFGHIYLGGGTTEDADVDPGPGVHILSSFGTFISKLDGSGNLIWAAQLEPRGATSIDYIAMVGVFDVGVDRSGNVYATGDFQRKADFDPGPANHLLTSIGWSDGFVLSLDADGGFRWVARAGGDVGMQSYSLDLDGFGNPHATGYLDDGGHIGPVEVDFDPGAGVVYPPGPGAVFVWKLLPAADCGGRTPTIIGTDASEVLIGTAGSDVIHGLGGDDEIRGLGGADVLCGGEGNDLLNGGAGADELRGGHGDDRLGGGAGDDALFGGPGADRLTGGPGQDLLRGTDGDDHLNGGGSSDELYGEGGADVLRGGDGADMARGGSGDDAIFGGAGADTLWGGAGFDTVDGGSGSDTCRSAEILVRC